jgi:hypothetical protein
MMMARFSESHRVFSPRRRRFRSSSGGARGEYARGEGSKSGCVATGGISFMQHRGVSRTGMFGNHGLASSLSVFFSYPYPHHQP